MTDHITRVREQEALFKPVAWAVYGRSTGHLRHITGDGEVDEFAEFYDVVPLIPASRLTREKIAEVLDPEAFENPLTGYGDAAGKQAREFALATADAVLALMVEGEA